MRKQVLKLSLMLSLLGLSGPAAVVANEESVHLKRILPGTIYAETRAGGVRLNFDIEIENTGEEDATLTYLELRAYSKEGQILSRLQMGGNGIPGPIAMLPSRTIQAGKSLYLFNPFPDIPTTGEITSLRFRVFHTKGSFETRIPVVPPPGPMLETPPIADTGFIFSGNDLFSHHRRISMNSLAAQEAGIDRITQRFALDMTVLDQETGDIGVEPADNLNNWPAYGTLVYAPVRGEVFEIRNDMPENTMNSQGQRVRTETYESYGENASLGNYVILKVEDAFLVMSHFQHGTLNLAVGDQVRAGQLLGKLGFSGDTAYPHLHMQLQSTPDILSAEPLPIMFKCAKTGTGTLTRLRANIALDTGQFFSSCLQ